MARHGGDLRWLTCPVCGKTVLKPAHVKTCSRECAIKHRREMAHKRACIVCGKEFTHTGYQAQGLCPDCRAVKGSGGGTVAFIKCPVCGKEVLRQSRFATCSRECGNILQWRPRKKWASAEERISAKAARRRMRMYNADGIIEAIDIREIYRRDKGVCGICGGHVDRKDASIDHIIPLSLGGQHTKSNVQLAHLLCNIRRGNRPLEAVQCLS